MSHHCPPDLSNLPVPQSGTLDDQDVFHVAGLTREVTEDTGGVQEVDVAMNEEDLLHAYKASCARAMASFDEFKHEIQQEVNAGALVAYSPARDLNNLWADSPNAQRILRIRICIRWRWIRIYVYWKI